MAKAKTYLGGRTDGEKREIQIRYYVFRDYRPTFRTGVFVNPKYFDGESGVIVPRASKRNVLIVKETTEAKSAFELYKGILTKVVDVCATKLGTDITTAFINDVVAAVKKRGIPTDEITFGIIQSLIEEERKEKEEQNQANNKRSLVSLAKEYLAEKKFSIQKEKNFGVIIRDVLRYQMFVRATASEYAKRDVYDKEPQQELTATERKDGKKGKRYSQLVQFYKDFTFDVDKVTADTINDFRDYLRNEYALMEQYPAIFKKMLEEVPHFTNSNHKARKTRKIEQKSENSIVILMKGLGAFFSWLNDTQRTANRPFESVKVGSEKYPTEPFFLTKEERDKLAEFDLSATPAIAVQRDIFIFQCLIGCRVSDLLTLRDENISEGVLTYNPIKTRHDENSIKPRVPLNARALALVEKYRGIDEAGRLFPFLTAQRYNDNIREALRIAGINRNVTIINQRTGKAELHPICEVASSHMARRTFVGNLYKSVKDPNLIGKMSGHKEGSKAFARYRDISDDDLKDTIKLLD